MLPDFDQTERCPDFEESLVQYCGAAPEITVPDHLYLSANHMWGRYV